jgi:hypothetical protein
LHFSDNSNQTQDSGRLFKIQPVYEYFLQKFRSVYIPEKELTSVEAMILLRGQLKIRMCSPGKIIKFEMLVRMMREAVSGYICNMQHVTERKKLENTVHSAVLDSHLGHNYNIYQDNFYDSVKLARKCY